MNTLLLFTVLFAAACMADVSHLQEKPHFGILRNTQDIHPDGSFKYGYETENGISADAEGSPDGETQHGSYRYVSPEGEPVEVIWHAGPEGFVAEGAVVPPVPAYVLRTLEYNAAHPYKEPVQP